MAYPKMRSAAAAVCAVTVLALSSQAPAQNAPTGTTATPHVQSTRPVVKALTAPVAKSCPTGYQGTPPNCVKTPHWDVTKNKSS